MADKQHLTKPVDPCKARNQAVVKVVPQISLIDVADWDACANPLPSGDYNPFVSHAFLNALEQSGCVGNDTGWIPRHLALEDQDEKIQAVMPCYLKTHSKGEYVFDCSWAEAMERAGADYYPKLQCAVPFTPVPGPRLMARPGPNSSHHQRLLAKAAVEFAERLGVSSLHVTFAHKEQCEKLLDEGFLLRTDQQFHWHNQGYKSFDGFLDTLSSRKRKTLRKERIAALGDGIEIERLQGQDITSEHWDTFFAFYLDTSERKWGRPYLNREFFELLGQTLSDRCLLVMAKRDGQYIACALNIIGSDCLYGRYWGALGHYPCLHFEICYYQAIDYAIANNLNRVEAGAQGEHKLARGYVPTPTYSAHWIANPGLRSALKRYLNQERRHVDHVQQALMDFTPYKRTDNPSDQH